jgi:PHD/YefM family antitoxin component YafN of YafNO toxin-antitoxin module
VDFVVENDLAFDSVAILADVSAAILLHPQSEWGAMEEELHVLWQRAAALARVAASAATDVQLDDADIRGQAALECLRNIFEFESADFNLSVAIDYGTLMLALDPRDHRNARRWLVNCFLLREDNYHALGLAQEFQHDTQPATRFGYLLALIRLKRVEDARRLLPTAQQAQPYVTRYLTAKKIDEPDYNAANAESVLEYEAWLYRRDMRAAWVATPGAMALLSADVDRKKLH